MPVKIIELRLPEAGKPAGLCSECGPHGNRGAVTLLWSVVPCLTCGVRADQRADCEGWSLRDSTSMQVVGRIIDEQVTVEPHGDHPWSRRVTIRVEWEAPA